MAPLSPLAVTVSKVDASTRDAADVQQLLDMGRGPRLQFPIHETLAALIEAQVARTPQAICAVHGAQRLSYAELDARAQSVAALLVNLGVAPGQFVAIVMPRGLDFLVAMVGIWKAGAAYIPVDPSYPDERMRYMLRDSQAKVAIFGAQALQDLLGSGQELGAIEHAVCMQPLPVSPAALRFTVHGPEALAAAPRLPAPHSAAATDAAYMLYTSGSTGRPKGAIVRHDGAVNHIYAQAHALGVEGISRFLQSAPSSSDISVWQFVGPLLFGGCTVVIDDVTDIGLLLRTVQHERLSMIELVPVVMKYLIDYAATLTPQERAWPQLRWAMVTGESASVDLINAWLRLWPGVPVVNAYGPTEAADDVAQAILREPMPAGTLTVPIGRALANMDVFVLDAQLAPVPLGEQGEICIAGVGVGAGYWQQPEKTQLSFVANPFASQPGAAGPVLYRSGDLGRWREDGLLECLGRLDHQVQLHGHRIELQEIEAVLREHPAVANAVVTRVHAEHDDAALAAYIVWQRGAALDDVQIRQHLASRLPTHMLPRHLVSLAKLPLNPAGKIDRQALPVPARSVALSPLPTPAGNVVELTLLQVWHDEFARPDIGLHDDFFDLGGDSLHALGIVVGARVAGLALRTADVLAHGSVARLACVVRPLTAPPAPVLAAPALTAVTALGAAEAQAFLAAHPAYESVHPLTPPQQAVFMHWMLARDKSTYVDQYAFELDGELDVPAFTQAWQLVAARHQSLRTAYLRSVLSQPVQAVSRSAALVLDVVDAHALSNAERQALSQAEVQRGFVLAEPGPMRLLLLCLAPGRHRLIWTHHHIVLDGWSMGLVLQDVLLAHEALRQGHAPSWPGAAADMREYLARLETLDIAPAEDFWRDALRGFAGSAGWPRKDVASPPGYGQLDVELDDACTQALAARARRGGWTLTTLLQAAWAVTVGALSGEREVMLGVVTSGREIAVPDIASMVGMFVTTLPLRVELAPSSLLTLWLDALQARAVAARAHEQVPLSHIARWSDVPTGRTLFDTLFVMSNYPGVAAQEPSTLMLRPGPFRTVPAYPLTLVVSPDSTLRLRLVHELRRLDVAAAHAVAQTLLEALRCLAAGADPRPGTPATASS